MAQFKMDKAHCLYVKLRFVIILIVYDLLEPFVSIVQDSIILIMSDKCKK